MHQPVDTKDAAAVEKVVQATYLAMFPPTIPHVFVTWLTRPGDTVYDPFSGRGTTPLEACLMGRVGIGSDANPLACLLTSAKVDPPSRTALAARLRELALRKKRLSPRNAPAEIRMLFSSGTLTVAAVME